MAPSHRSLLRRVHRRAALDNNRACQSSASPRSHRIPPNCRGLVDGKYQRQAPTKDQWQVAVKLRNGRQRAGDGIEPARRRSPGGRTTCGMLLKGSVYPTCCGVGQSQRGRAASDLRQVCRGPKASSPSAESPNRCARTDSATVATFPPTREALTRTSKEWSYGDSNSGPLACHIWPSCPGLWLTSQGISAVSAEGHGGPSPLVSAAGVSELRPIVPRRAPPSLWLPAPKVNYSASGIAPALLLISIRKPFSTVHHSTIVSARRLSWPAGDGQHPAGRLRRAGAVPGLVALELGVNPGYLDTLHGFPRCYESVICLAQKRNVRRADRCHPTARRPP